MNTKNRIPDAETSTLDDDRINLLIARYYNLHDSSKELQVGDFKTCATNTRARKNMKRTAPPYTISLVQVNPMMDSNFVYKIRSNDADSEKEQDDGNFNIKILSDDDSFHSPSNDSVSSGPKTSWKRFKISCDADRSNRVTFQDDSKNEEQQTSFTYDVRKSYAEKTTYCRPITNIYDSNFVHKVMERNTKLQLLLTKFLITRQKEKENEKWNNYVNDLIMMNHCYKDLSKHALPPGMVQEDINPTLVKDFYSAKNKLTKSDSCREILNDFYTSKNEQYIENPPEYEERECFNNNTLKNVYDNQQYCFPSTSRDRTNKKRNNHDWPYHRSLYDSSIVVSDEKLSNNATITNGKLRISSPKSARNTKLSSHLDKNKYVQTHITFGGYANSSTYFENDLKTELRATVSEQYVSTEDNNKIENKAARKEQSDIATESFFDLKEMPTKSIPRLKTPIEGLDEKIETLIKLFSSFIVDLKSKEELKSDQSNDMVDINDTDRNLTPNQSTSKSVKKKKKKVTIVGNVMTNTSLSAFEQQSQFNTSQNLLNSKLNKILYEELDKSNKLRNEIEAMLKTTTCRPCAVQINIEVPTRERSTEVTESLPKTTLSVSRSSEIPIEDVCSSFDRPAPQGRLVNENRELSTSMRRIAENTDPWGLLSVLRFSTDAVKQILSLVPTVNCWHLTNDTPHPADEANYVCNVCGAVFRRPSQLSAHILAHDLGQARTNSICHQSPGTVAPSMFRCEYCGQRFIRAYCCELHQQSCAQRLGKSEGSSSLVMLR